MYIINNQFLCDTSPYACKWTHKFSDRPWLLQPVKCSECGKHLRSCYFDYDKLIIDDGVLPDMLYSDLVVSEKFRTAWLDSGLKGIADFLPIPVYQRKNKRHVAVKQRYYEVVVNVPHLKVDVRKSSMVDDYDIFADNGDEVIVPEGKRCWIYWQCPVCGYVERTFSPYRDQRVSINWDFPDNLVYDGTTDDDIFTFTNVFNGYKMGGNPLFYIVSDRFISFVRENKLTNVYALTPEELRKSLPDVGALRFTPVYTEPSAADIE